MLGNIVSAWFRLTALLNECMSLRCSVIMHRASLCGMLWRPTLGGHVLISCGMAVYVPGSCIATSFAECSRKATFQIIIAQCFTA